jgi:hypothetical protein
MARSGLRLPLATPLTIAGVGACALAAAAFPLTGSPGPEAAQMLAAVGGPLLLLAGAARGAERHERGFFGDLIMHGLLLAACMLIVMAVVTVSGWSSPSCAPGRGYMPFFVLAMPVLALDGVIGLWIGRLFGNKRVALGAAATFLLLYGVWITVDWFVDPSFRFLTHLLVLVEGDMIRGRGVSPAGFAYRVATMSYAGALCLFGMSRFAASKRTSGLANSAGGHPAFTIGAVLLGVLGAVVHQQSGAALAPDSGDLREAYSLEVKRGALVVHADPAAISAREVDAILAEGTLWLDRLDKRMGAVPEEDIHIFLHRDSRTMGKWTGAENVHFALPGRSELHITGVDVPHDTLGHELAHVLGRQLAGGVLGVPTRLGVLPNTGMIEGLAMAMTPELEVRDGLTLREKAAAMRQSDRAPPVEELFGEYLAFFRFWRHPPGNAYVTAGAVVEAVAAVAGRDGLARMYAEGNLEAAFETEGALAAFLHDHDEALRTAELPPDALPTVARRYSRASILEETCDPDAKATAGEIRSAARTGDFSRAEELAKKAEGQLTPKTLLALARAALALDDDERATHYMVRRAAAAAQDDPRERNETLEDAANAMWRAGRERDALAAWQRIELDPLPPWRRRYVVAKRLLADAARARPDDRDLSAAGLDLLLDAHDRDSVALIARIAEGVGRAQEGGSKEPDEIVAFARYLLMRQYLQRGELDVGLRMALDLYLDRERLHPLILDQVTRGIAAGHARRGDLALAAAGFESIASAAPRGADRVLMRDRAERVRRMLAARTDKTRRGDRWLLGLNAAGGL